MSRRSRDTDARLAMARLARPTTFHAQIVSNTGDVDLADIAASFTSARAAWGWLAEQRKAHEDSHEAWGTGEYSDTLEYLRYAATDAEYGNPHEDWPLAADGTGEIVGAMPGQADSGVTYKVTVD